MGVMWNLWHGCHKLSEGCANCYVYMGDERHGRESGIVEKTKSFTRPVDRNRKGEYKLPSGTTVYTCFTSDFFIEDADHWRNEAWDMIRERPDLYFMMITKRIDRLAECIPEDWGDGWDNVTICCTVENNRRAAERLPVYMDAPVKHKVIICEPLLERLDLSLYLGPWVEQVVVGGESGAKARPCDYGWVTQIRDLCIANGVSFWFKQTGAKFVRDGVLYGIPRRLQHSQARKAAIDYGEGNRIK